MPWNRSEARDVMRKFKPSKAMVDEEADIGIGSLIIFIAIVLVAAIAASLLLYSASMLQQQAQRSAEEAIDQVSGGLYTVNLAGDRNVNGSDSTVASGTMPVTDDTSPTGGILNNVTVTANGVAPLAVTLNWTSSNDYSSGLAEERIYRTSVIDPTNTNAFNEAVAAGRMMTISDVKNTNLIAVVTNGFGQRVLYTDYTARDNVRTSYAYAVIGIDKAGNEALYSDLRSTVSTSAVAVDEDVLAPAGGSMTSASSTGPYTVALFWVPATDAGSGVKNQTLYYSTVPMNNPASSIVNGRTHLALGSEAKLLKTFNATVSSFVVSPTAPGTFYYGIVASDKSENQFFYGRTSITVATGDSLTPEPVNGLIVKQGLQCVILTWDASSDAQSGVSEYRIYRAFTSTAIDSVDELVALTPLVMILPDSLTILTYSDYSGVYGTTYYYTVVAVDKAGNLADPVTPTGAIQMIEIKVKLLPGSRSILFDSMVIEVTDGVLDAALSFNKNVFGSTGATAGLFSVDILRDPDGEFARSHSLSAGSLLKIFVNAREIGLDLHSGAEVSMKFIPKSGHETIEIFTIPALASGRYVQMI